MKSIVDLKFGEVSKIKKVKGRFSDFFLNIGLTPNVRIKRISMGDPSAYSFRGTVYAFRKDEAKGIGI